MKGKKQLAVLLSGMMVFGMLAGCGGNKPEEDLTAENVAGTSAVEEQGGEGEERPTFTIATVRLSDAFPSDFLESGMMKELEDKHNINIEWQIYYYLDWAEQKSLLLASGDMPDAFLGSLTLNASDMAQNQGAIVELTDRIEKNMPNLTAAFEKDPALKAIVTDSEGKIYSLPKKLPNRPRVCGNILYLNKEWMDNLNLEMPTTYLELENVLEKFVTEDADGDGDPGNEIGITGAAGNNVLSMDLRNILFPFGTMVSRGDNYMGLNGEGTPVFMPAQENYKEAVKWMHGMYEKGIVDPEYFTQEGSMAMAKKQAEGGAKVGLVSGWTADAELGANAGQFVPLEAVEGPDGKRYVENAANFADISDRELIITTNCSDPDKLLQWADDFYTDVNTLQSFYGSIPDCITENEDGTYTVKAPENGMSLDVSAWSNSLRDYGPKYMNPEFYEKIILPEGQGDGIKLAEDKINEKYVTDDKNVGLPKLQYPQDDLVRMTTLGTDIYKYCEAQYAHWVVDGGIEEEWDAYLEQLEKMGLQELVDIHCRAYEAYQNSLSG